jgi:hypothetical protein
MFSRSTDGGLTWSPPVRVNDDVDESGTNIQWFGTMSVAPNGRIDAIWLDTREDIWGTDSSALYYSYSIDEGNTWSANEKLSPSFNPHVGYPNQNKMGDYFDIHSDNVGAHVAWTNTLNGEQDVYYSRIIPDIPVGINSVEGKLTASVYPNPFHDEITFKSTGPNTELILYDVLSKPVVKQSFSGSITVNTENLSKGVYIYELRNEGGIIKKDKVIRQ